MAPDSDLDIEEDIPTFVQLYRPVTELQHASIAGRSNVIYPNLRAGRGQAIRYMALDNDIDMEDEIVTFTDRDAWNNGPLKASLPFGQLPVLYDGDFVVPQSNAILRYLARKNGLHPSDVEECARVDMINDHVEDMRVAYLRLIYQNYEEGKEDYIKGIGTKLQPLEKLLKSWGNDFINNKISFADYNLYDVLDNHLVLAPGCLDAYPTVKAYYERIGNRPKIQAVRATEAFKKMNINGNGKQ